MRLTAIALAVGPLAFGLATAAPWSRSSGGQSSISNIQLRPRPIISSKIWTLGKLKTKLQSCSEGPFHRTDFAISHRGAPLQFPEDTKVSWMAAARMGAGIIECDVTFTKDRQLVCRH